MHFGNYVCACTDFYMFKNELNHIVAWGETDPAGIVFYPNFYHWFDFATHEMFKAAGLSPSELLSSNGIILPLVSSAADFFKPVKYDETVTIQTTVEKVGSKSITISHKILLYGEVAVKGIEVRVWVKQTDGEVKGMPIPENVKSILLGR